MDDDVLDELRMPGSPRDPHAVLVAALLHLMSHYTINSTRHSAANGAARGGEAPCIKLASVIERHLNALARLPDADPVLRATCEQLSVAWAGLVDNAMPAPAPVKRPLLERILRGGTRRAAPPPLAASPAARGAAAVAPAAVTAAAAV